MFWHGSTALITRPYLIPGEKLGVDRYDMGRNKTVFVSDHLRTAVDMGCPQWREYDGRPDLRNINTAPFVYLVEPINVYPRNVTKPYSHIVTHENMCDAAVVVRAWKARRDSKPNTLADLARAYEEFEVGSVTSFEVLASREVVLT